MTENRATEYLQRCYGVYSDISCGNCPYRRYKKEGPGCIYALHEDAIAMLKEQEPKTPIHIHEEYCEGGNMSTYKFEVAAKNAIIKGIKEKYNEDYRIQDISVVWMTHLLNNKKGVFVDNGKNLRLYEVTYNKERDEMYLDMYEKWVNKLIPADEFDFEAHEFID